MEKKKISSKTVFALVFVVCLIVFLLFYFKGYSATNDKTKALKNENVTLTATVEELKVYYENEETNRQAIEDLKVQIKDLAESFDPMIKPEDMIMEAVELQGYGAIEYKDITMEEPAVVYEVPLETVQLAQMEEYQLPFNYVKARASYNNDIDYFSLKSVIQQIYNSRYNVNISNVTYVRNDETLALEGTIELSYYYLTGNNREYSYPQIPAYTSGSDNIFGIIKIGTAK